MNTFFLSNTPLFHGISESEISELLSCLGAKERKYKKDEIIIRAGSSVSEIGLVESGSVNIVRHFTGETAIFSVMWEKDRFLQKTMRQFPARSCFATLLPARRPKYSF